jgi:cytochrome c peroxidase
MVAMCIVFASVLSGCSSKEAPSESGTSPEVQEEAGGSVDAPAESGAEESVEVAAASRAPESPQTSIKEHLEGLKPIRQLGGRIFFDSRMSNPGANLAASCSTCHVPPFWSNGLNVYSDSLAVSVIPANSRGGKLTTVRNTPSLQDAKLSPALNADGEFSNLDGVVRAKLISEHLGWEADQELQAYNEIHALMLNDQGEDLFADGSYIEQFKAAADLNLEALSQEDVITEVVEALKAYMRMIKTRNTSAYDALTFLNRFNEELGDGDDTPQALSGRIYGRIANQEGRVLIRFPNIYTEEAYQGYKTFVRVQPTFSSSVEGLEQNIGNCIACHTPPKFTDGLFHNTGTAQTDYDATHGEGAFAKLEAEDAVFARVTADDPLMIDLGRYRVHPGEDTIGAFRTPGLRNIELTAPYNHDGKLMTLEDVIRHKIKVSEMAKAGKLRNPHPAYLTMNITEKDVPTLAAFLRTLNEVPEEEYRDFRIDNVRIRQDLMEDSTYEN